MNNTDKEQAAQIKVLLDRLNTGEPFEKVQEDFRRQFAQADPQAIMDAEHQLMNEGMAAEEIQPLCDLHSTLFHGAESCHAAPLEPGHPLYLLAMENEALKKRLDQPGEDLLLWLKSLEPIGLHYAKKDALILPVLKHHGYPGPNTVMWNADDEIRQSLHELTAKGEAVSGAEVNELIGRIKEMLYKEETILFPLAMRHFTEKEWQIIRKDMDRYGFAWDIAVPAWNKKIASVETSDGRILLAGGSLTVEQLDAMLKLLPMELTFIDDQDINRYFSENAHLFARPQIALNNPVYDCHPPKAQAMVRSVISQLKSGQKDVISLKGRKKGQDVLIQYMAVRSDAGKYLGVLEIVQKA